MFEIFPNFQQFLQRFPCIFPYFAPDYFSLSLFLSRSCFLLILFIRLLGCIKWAVVHATGFIPLVFIRCFKQQTLKLQWCACSILIPPLFNLSCACQIFPERILLYIEYACQLCANSNRAHICTYMYAYEYGMLLKIKNFNIKYRK